MNASWHRRLLIVSLITLLTLTPFKSAFASPPELITIPVDETFEIGECGGFTVIQHEEGTIKLSTHFDKNGNFVMDVARYGLRETFSNSVTGASLTSPNVGIDKVTISQDGSATLAVIGLVTRIVLPGNGPIFTYLGRLVFNLDTGELLFEAGQHESFAGLLPALCSALE